MKLNVSKVSRMRTTCAACFSVALVAGCNSFKLPEPPDMQPLVKAYEEPDGTLDSDNAEELGQQVLDSVMAAQMGAPVEVSNEVVDSVAKLGGAEPQGSDAAAPSNPDSVDPAAGTQTVAGNKIDVAAKVKLHRICRGWNNRIDEAKNGSVDLTVTFDQAGLIPTVWGELSHCRFKRGITSVELDGVVQLHFGTHQARIGLRALKSVGYLVNFDGSVMAIQDGAERHADIGANFRAFPNGDIQLSVNMVDGTNVVAVFQAGALVPTATMPAMIAAGVITRDATWACQLNPVARTGSCSNKTDPSAAVVQW
jgi:hypothetical protein